MQDAAGSSPHLSGSEPVALSVAKNHLLERESETLCYAIAHELRPPLRAISGHLARILEEDDPLSRREAVSAIAAKTVKMGKLIDDLLFFAELGRKEPRRVPLDLDQVVLEVSRELMAGVLGEEVRLKLGKLPPANADPDMLRLALKHLLDNALKFTRLTPEPLIEVGGWEKGGERIIFVKDNGVGFEELYREELFRLFHKLHREEQYGGNGVGLALVKRVARKHGGRVWAEGAPGKGASFYFAIPIDESNSSH